MTQAAYKNMTNTQLVKIYNDFGPLKTIKAWKGKKEVLIEKIHLAEKQSGVDLQKPEKVKSPKKRTGAIRIFCEEALMQAAYHEDKTKEICAENRRKTASAKTRPVGFSFIEILDQLKKEFPDARTSYACLRWYAVHLRNADKELPRRPKSSWK